VIATAEKTDCNSEVKTMKRLAFTVAAFCLFFSLPAFAEVTGLEEKVRNSEAVVAVDVTRVDPNLIVIKVTDVLKGGAAAKALKRVGIGEGGEDQAFKKGEKAVLFVGEIHEDVAVLYGGVDGRLAAKDGDLNEFKSVIRNLLALDAASGKAAKTAQLKKMLASPGFYGKFIALQETILKSGDYDLQQMLPLVNPLLKDKNPKIRSKAMLAVVRIYDFKANGTSRDDVLLNMLIGMLDDGDIEVRELAGVQLKSHSGNRKISFDAKGTPEERNKAIQEWKTWVTEKKDDTVETEFE
jgi:hypothetical protein